MFIHMYKSHFRNFSFAWEKLNKTIWDNRMMIYFAKHWYNVNQSHKIWKWNKNCTHLFCCLISLKRWNEMFSYPCRWTRMLFIELFKLWIERGNGFNHPKMGIGFRRRKCQRIRLSVVGAGWAPWAMVLAAAVADFLTTMMMMMTEQLSHRIVAVSPVYLHPVLDHSMHYSSRWYPNCWWNSCWSQLPPLSNYLRPFYFHSHGDPTQRSAFDWSSGYCCCLLCAVAAPPSAFDPQSIRFLLVHFPINYAWCRSKSTWSNRVSSKR